MNIKDLPDLNMKQRAAFVINEVIKQVGDVDKVCCDSSFNCPKPINIANAICSRYNAGIVRYAQTGVCVIEKSK